MFDDSILWNEGTSYEFRNEILVRIYDTQLSYLQSSDAQSKDTYRDICKFLVLCQHNS